MLSPFPRRRFLQGAAMLPVLGPAVSRTALPAGLVRPRADWAGGLDPAGPLQPEPDVRFLLVHHSVSRNDYSRAEVPGLIRGFFAAHTGPDKGWPDVAYNFFVDRHGDAWEGRAGSLDGPVQADATGGSQGFAQLCCLIGDHRDEPPSDAARATLTRLLAALADRYGVDTRPGTTATFTSRGSNRWPDGVTVTTATLSAHRDVSRTECPGDAAYALVRDELPAAVTALRLPAPTPTPEPTATAAPSATPAPTGTPVPPSGEPVAAADRGPDPTAPLLVGGTAALAVAAAALARRRAAGGAHRRRD